MIVASSQVWIERGHSGKKSSIFVAEVIKGKTLIRLNNQKPWLRARVCFVVEYWGLFMPILTPLFLLRLWRSPLLKIQFCLGLP